METYFPFDETLKSTDDTQATFTRASTATNPDTGATVAANEPRFVEGRFGKAVLVEEGTTNLVTLVASSLLDVDGGGGVATGWTKYKPTAISATWEVSQQSQRIELTGGSTLSSAMVLVSVPVTGGKAYSLSVDAKKDDASPDVVARLVARWQDDAGYIGGAPTIVQTAATDFTRLSIINAVAPPNATRIQVQLACVPQSIGATGAVRLRRAQLEAKPYATTFVNGTRAAEALRIPSSVMNDNNGTLEIWAKKSFVYAAYRKILDAENPRIDFQWASNGNLSANFGGANIAVSDPAQDTAWHHYALTYSGRTVKMYYDGALMGTGTATIDLVSFTDLFVGSRYAPDVAGMYHQGNAAYSGLRLHRRALSDEEIAAHAAGDIGSLGDCYHYPFDGNLWPAPGSLGAVVAPSIITRPGKLEVIGR